MRKIYLFLASIMLSVGSNPFHCLDLTPINVISQNAQFKRTSAKPLTVVQSQHQTSLVENTGKSLTSTTYEPYLAKVYGGLLNDTYLFCQDEFYWDLQLKPDAGVEIDEKGSTVQAVLTFSNNGCDDIKQNSNVQSGSIIQMVFFVQVVLFPPAPSFGNFASTVNLITDADSSTTASEFDVCKWFFTGLSDQVYYTYKGFNDVTVIAIPKTNYMSYTQFYRTFGALKNKRERPFSHIAPLVIIDPPPQVTSSKGVRIITTS